MLTDDEIEQSIGGYFWGCDTTAEDMRRHARAIEAAVIAKLVGSEVKPVPFLAYGRTPVYTELMIAAAVAKYKQDAERYRWFAHIATTGDFEIAEKAFACFADAESCTKEELDAAIDAAIKGVTP